MALIPIALAANQPPDRFYAGGEQIAAFRGLPWQGGNVPEDWVGATTTLFGETSLGLSVLPDGRLLRDVIASDPVGWLGAQHVARFGADTKLLTKLLDAGQRLPVHIHPDATFAADHLHRTHGKTEAWVVLGGGTVHLGFKDRLSPDLLGRLVQEQDVRTLLGAMHQLEVSTGDAVLVPAGMPHAIGAGVFLVEVQEPEDLSILLEWRDFAIDGPRDGHLGLGFDRALRATDLTDYSAREIEDLVSRRTRTGPVLPDRAADFFRVDRVAVGAVLDASFAVLVITRGQGDLRQVDVGHALAVRSGHTILVPHQAGSLVIDGDLEALWCRPPQA